MRRATKLLPMLVLTILIVVNVALFVLLFRSDLAIQALPASNATGTARATEAIASPGTPSVSRSASETSSPESSASTEPTSSAPSSEPTPPQRLLFAKSSNTAWRATVGDCGTPGQVERSTNGGTSWKRVVRTGLAPIVRLGETGGDLFTIGGSGESCSTRYVAYATDGKVTASTRSPVDVWFQTPDDRDEVNGPGDRKARPCKDHVVGLAPLDLSRALVVCTDGSAMSTQDAGKAWREVARVPGTLAIGSGDGRYWLAGTAIDCEGITVRSLTINRRTASQGTTRCALTDEVAPGEVALDVSGDAIWIWTGSRVQVSTDSGRSWA